MNDETLTASQIPNLVATTEVVEQSRPGTFIAEGATLTIGTYNDWHRAMLIDMTTDEAIAYLLEMLDQERTYRLDRKPPAYGSINVPAPILTWKEKCEAIMARITAKWDDASLVKAGVVLPNLRDNIERILQIPPDDRVYTPPVPEQMIPITAMTNLAAKIKTLLTKAGYEFLAAKITYLELDAIDGIGPVYAKAILAEIARLKV